MSTSGMSQASEHMEKKNDYENTFFLGTVVDNKDPEFTERLRIRIPNLLGPEIPDDQLPWARPIKHRGRGASGKVQSLSVPIIGSKMIVVLQNGDPYHAMYLGGMLVKEDVNDIFKTNYPDRYGIADDKGNHLYVDAKTGDVDILHFSGLNIHIRPNGTIDIQSPADLNANFAGNVHATVGGNTEVNTSGNTTVTSGGNTTVTSGGTVTITAPLVSIN